MSDAFWDGMQQIGDLNIEAMGETVTIGAQADIQAVPQPVNVDPANVPGGRMEGVTHQLQVSLEVGDQVADGDLVTCRQLSGRVITKIHYGGGWLILAGPRNRAGGFSVEL